MASFEYTVKHPLGLHMRPAGLMVTRLTGQSCQVTIRCGTRSADAKSILNVMAMAVKCGETVSVEVSGEDEENVCRSLREFFEANF